MIREHYKRGFFIEAMSINYKKGMKKTKNRSFENNTLGDVIRIIARENGFKSRIDFEKEKNIEVIEQETSDTWHFVTDWQKHMLTPLKTIL